MRRSAFQEAIAHLGKAIEMADKARHGAAGEIVGRPASQRLKLHVAYGNAMMFAARASRAGDDRSLRERPRVRARRQAMRAERLARRLRPVGRQLRARRATASRAAHRRSFLGDVGGETRFARSRRLAASPGARLAAGSPESTAEARTSLERALALFNRGARRRSGYFRFGHGRCGVARCLSSRLRMWPSGRGPERASFHAPAIAAARIAIDHARQPHRAPYENCIGGLVRGDARRPARVPRPPSTASRRTRGLDLTV